MDTKKTGLLIAQLRKERGLTQKQLADCLHISDRTISKWERGAGFPDVTLLGPLADALDVSVVNLLKGELDLKNDVEISTREAILAIYRQTKRRILKNFTSILAGLCLVTFWVWFIWVILEYNGVFLKDASLSVPAVVYQEGEAVADTVITIDGKRGRSSFVGTFAIDYVEKTTRDGVQGYVGMGREETYPILKFWAYGGPWDCGIKRQIYISDDMMRMALELEDGTIIATDDWLMELMALEGYYPLDF